VLSFEDKKIDKKPVLMKLCSKSPPFALTNTFNVFVSAKGGLFEHSL